MPEKLSHGPRANSDLNRCAGLSRGPNLQKKLTAAAWSNTFPAPSSTLDLDFANNRGFVRGAGQGESMDAVTFTRASVGKYIDSTGTLVDAANNVPRFDWASTESTGAGTAANPYVIPLQANPTCNGLLIEESRANRLLWCRDATNAAWTATNVTTAKNQTGIDGVANAASSLTASADGGTCIQTITLASGSRTSSVYLKRLTGTGNIQVTLDGSTWSTVDLSNGLWNHIVISGTVTNPTVGIKIATNGDAVAMDYGQVEDGAFATSPILTTTASVTRSADATNVKNDYFDEWFNKAIGTVYAETASGQTSGRIFGYDGVAAFVAISTSTATFTSNGTSTLTKTGGAIDAFINPVKHAMTYSPDGRAVTREGLVPAISTTTFVGNVTSAWIGRAANGTGPLNGCVKRIVYYPKRLNDNTLQILTGGAT